jgi:hypothetical protein
MPALYPAGLEDGSDQAGGDGLGVTANAPLFQVVKRARKRSCPVLH